jgi:hypothetical protein
MRRAGCYPFATLLLPFCYPFATLLLPFCYPFATLLLPFCYPIVFVRLFITSSRARSTRAAASSCIPGITCEYKSIVIPTFECPRRSLAILGCTPVDNMWVA